MKCFIVTTCLRNFHEILIVVLTTLFVLQIHCGSTTFSSVGFCKIFPCMTCGHYVVRAFTSCRWWNCEAQIKIQFNNTPSWWTHPQPYENAKTSIEGCVCVSKGFRFSLLCFCIILHYSQWIAWSNSFRSGASFQHLIFLNFAAKKLQWAQYYHPLLWCYSENTGGRGTALNVCNTVPPKSVCLTYTGLKYGAKKLKADMQELDPPPDQSHAVTAALSYRASVFVFEWHRSKAFHAQIMLPPEQ